VLDRKSSLFSISDCNLLCEIIFPTDVSSLILVKLRLHVNLAPLEAQCIEPVASTSGLVSAVQSKVSNVSPPEIAKRRRPTKRGKKGQKKRKTGPKYPCGVFAHIHEEINVKK
jgi:hypothetical protein